MSLPGTCPICGGTPLIRLPLEYDVLVEKSGEKHPIGALMPYHCAKNLHLFFVLSRDAEEAESVY